MALFSKIIIANRGEIARRVIRTARRLGIGTVAVYSDADRNALHVKEADEAIWIGPAPALESYLQGDKIIEAALKTGAQGVHPGYGFLSENTGFAEACAEAGISFIGPPADAIRAMGSKSAAKAIMQKAGVPISPGYHGDDQSLEKLSEEAEKIGYPVMIKASAGGGGKGMRLVEAPEAFADSLASCKRESSAAFGDDHVLIEKFIQNPRHIEVQVFCDTLGGAVHLFERDCSLQRRHQKVVEESPAPNLSEALRAEMCQAAVDAARAVSYVGAGTVEFIVETDKAGTPTSFYFMEMNTRLQVEHPVTEMVTGLDLVEWQLRVASGEALPLVQDAIQSQGWAFEARLYAEDPQNGFAPSIGEIALFETPKPDAQTRVDAAVGEGDAVSIHYDPMIAKIITSGASRDEALARMDSALAQTHLVGLSTNRDFLRGLIEHPSFKDCVFTTGLIDQQREALIPAPLPAAPQALAFAALYEILDREREVASNTSPEACPDPSPWVRLSDWRLTGRAVASYVMMDGEQEVSVSVSSADGGFHVSTLGEILTVCNPNLEGRVLQAEIDGVRKTAHIVTSRDQRVVILGAEMTMLRLYNPLSGAEGADVGDGRLIAPMPGKIVSVLVDAGASVEQGTALVVLEAMKMEHTIVALTPGIVETVKVREGDQVEEGVELITIAPVIDEE